MIFIPQLGIVVITGVTIVTAYHFITKHFENKYKVSNDKDLKIPLIPLPSPISSPNNLLPKPTSISKKKTRKESSSKEHNSLIENQIKKLQGRLRSPE